MHFRSFSSIRKSTLHMKLLAYSTCIGILIGALFLISCATPNAVEPMADIGPDVPRTAAEFRDAPGDFQFAIVADRMGGHREGVFKRALKKVNLLEPAFVINIGDLIEGYSEDPVRLAAQWDEMDSMVDELDMPFFFVVGNHDVGNNVMLDVWHERRGSDYYHFVYKDVLFLVMNTEDPPVLPSKEIAVDIEKLRELMKTDREKAEQMVMASKPLQKAILYPKIGDEQTDYSIKVLSDKPDVRWTFVFMHKPAWKYGTENFKRIESMLEGRNHTVFAGHEHYYQYMDVNGRDYIQLGTTGGDISKAGPGSFDHFAIVKMTDRGPKIANILPHGILDHTGNAIIE